MFQGFEAFQASIFDSSIPEDERIEFAPVAQLFEAGTGEPGTRKVAAANPRARSATSVLKAPVSAVRFCSWSPNINCLHVLYSFLHFLFGSFAGLAYAESPHHHQLRCFFSSIRDINSAAESFDEILPGQ